MVYRSGSKGPTISKLHVKSLNVKRDLCHSHLNWPAMYLFAPAFAVSYLILLHNAIYPTNRDAETTPSVQNAIGYYKQVGDSGLHEIN